MFYYDRRAFLAQEECLSGTSVRLPFVLLVCTDKKSILQIAPRRLFTYHAAREAGMDHYLMNFKDSSISDTDTMVIQLESVLKTKSKYR